MKNNLRAVISTLLLWAASFSPASAAPITITSGLITVTGIANSTPVELRGTDGVLPFTFSGSISFFSGFGVRDCCGLGTTSLSLYINSVDLDMPGALTYGEDSYPVGAINDRYGAVHFFVSGFALMPPPPTAANLTAIISGSFQVDEGSRFQAPISGGPYQNPFAELNGTGVATVTLLSEDLGDQLAWSFRTAQYRFGDPTPVPEPTSPLLLSSGLACLALQRRKRGTARRDGNIG